MIDKFFFRQFDILTNVNVQTQFFFLINYNIKQKYFKSFAFLLTVGSMNCAQEFLKNENTNNLVKEEEEK